MKLSNKIATIALLSSITINAFAVDTIMIVPRLFIDSEQFAMTKSLADNSIGYDNESVGAMIWFFAFLPFTLLNEDTSQLSVSSQELKELGYNEEEIQEYASDIEKIGQAASKEKIKTSKDLKEMTKKLDLGVVATEQLRLN